MKTVTTTRGTFTGATIDEAVIAGFGPHHGAMPHLHPSATATWGQIVWWDPALHAGYQHVARVYSVTEATPVALAVAA